MTVVTAQQSPSSALRAALKSIIRGAFATPDLVEVLDGRMHPAKQGPRASISPVNESEGVRVLDQNTVVVVQVFLPWNETIDPQLVVDPTLAETYAEKIREALYTATHPLAGTAGLWDFRILQVNYLMDPTGQMTRFEMVVQGIGQNFAETTA